MTIAEHSAPPKRHSPRKIAKTKDARATSDVREAVLRLVGPLWAKWYGTPVILILLLLFGVWRALSESQQRAVLSSAVSFYENLAAAKYDVAIDGLDLTRLDKSARPVPRDFPSRHDTVAARLRRDAAFHFRE